MLTCSDLIETINKIFESISSSSDVSSTSKKNQGTLNPIKRMERIINSNIHAAKRDRQLSALFRQSLGNNLGQINVEEGELKL
jgi:hypothetical protein